MPSNEPYQDPDAGRSDSVVQFPETRWTLMREIQTSAPERAMELIGELCVLYRPAIEGYFKIKCRDVHYAQDLAQSFHQHLLSKNRLKTLERRPETRFRRFLAATLKNFWLDHLPPAPAAESKLPVDSIDEALNESLLDEQIACEMHQRALRRLSEKAERPEKQARLRELCGFILKEGNAESYGAAGARLSLTPNAVKKAVHDLRQSYYDMFRSEVSEIVDRAELDEELRHLMTLLPDALSRHSHGMALTGAGCKSLTPSAGDCA